ncbi:PP0621 family protein [Acidiferrobacter sp.]|uniref:PP0621 family protein n=1 Tax=Acidiferrobacter sp. TaxID=1872107 RepID=UPI00342501CC
MKLLVDLLVIWAAWWFIRRALRPQHRSHFTPRPTPPRRRVRAAGDMVACHHCGLYVPRSEAVPGAHGTMFCSLEHRDAPTRG